MTDPRRILTVHEVASQVRNLLEKSIGRVWIEGECSNVSTPSSGHIYFTLKDDQSQLQAAWFKGRRGPEDLVPRNGMKIRVLGLVTAYERSSQFQVRVEQAEDAGLGDLRKQFEALKAKLQAEGLFDPERKKPLPKLPRRIGVVTSPTGAAVRDILQVLTRRYPDREVLIVPVPVQGDAAPGRIARAVEWLSTSQQVDVMIVGRGGGSLEDLWAFNEEIVARAIAAATLPVISAVGHETDFTISDFVADLRAPTPSAAAELVIDRKADLLTQLARMEHRLVGALDQRRLRLRNRLSRMQAHRLFHEPAHVVKGHRQNLLRLQDRMQRSLQRRVTQPAQQLSEARLTLRHSLERSLRDAQRHVDDLNGSRERGMKVYVQDLQRRLSEQQRHLHALNPYEVLRRGFSITRSADGKVIPSVCAVSEGDRLETLLHGGRIVSTVDGKSEVPFDPDEKP